MKIAFNKWYLVSHIISTLMLIFYPFLNNHIGNINKGNFLKSKCGSFSQQMLIKIISQVAFISTRNFIECKFFVKVYYIYFKHRFIFVYQKSFKPAFENGVIILANNWLCTCRIFKNVIYYFKPLFKCWY